MKLTFPHRLYGLGAILLVALTICYREICIPAALNVILLHIRSTSPREDFP